jgi:predicted PurR-regulated permease PerM
MVATAIPEKTLTHGLLDELIRAGLIAVLTIACYQVFQPFRDLLLWSLILAVTFYPLHGKLKGKLGIGDGRAASLIVLVTVALLMVPIYLMGTSIADSVERSLALGKAGDWRVPPPPDSIASLPLIGQRLHGFWQQASGDPTSLMQTFMPYLKDLGVTLLGTLAGVGGAFLAFIGALIIAGILMAYGDNGSRSAVRIASRISSPDRGPQIVDLCTATIRAVAQGVVGIAFVQALLVGGGFVVMGIPGAALLALVVLLLGIMQLPATLITLPVIGFILVTQGLTAATIVFAVYSLVAGLADNVLKPLLLGRGVNVPMPVVLIGALGGMVTGGIIGLFLGPVLLAVGYMLFWQWVEDEAQSSGPATRRPT